MSETSCWVLTDGKMGCRRQARGLAKALMLPYLEKIAHKRKPYYWLPARCYRGSLKHLHPSSDTLLAPWPSYVIACGYRTVPISLAIRAASSGQSCCIHVQNPRIPSHYFDWVVAAEHDQLHGANVITHLGALHDIDAKDLAQARQAPLAQLDPARGKPLGIVIGGSTARQRLSPVAIKRLTQSIAHIVASWQGPCWLLSSRRTPKALYEKLQTLSMAHQHCTLMPHDIPQAYVATLALADTIMVTEDSSSMISEACGSGKPVYILPLAGYRQRQKIKYLLDELQKKGYCRPWQGHFASWSYTPLDAARQAADRLLNRMHQAHKSNN